MSAVLPAAVDHNASQGFNATYELRLRGGVPLGMRFEEGDLTIDAGPVARADCRISAEPVAFLLLAYGRMKPWRYLLSGRLLAWGRRPWLASRFNTMLMPF
jgi:hypothetical protein